VPVFSEQLGLMGKIDVYKRKEKKLIERKYQLKQIFQGQIFSFYEISTNKMMPISLPSDADRKELESFIAAFKSYDPLRPIRVNPNKCRHCIYCNLCDKTDEDNVY